MEVSRKIARNTLTNSVGFLVQFLANLMLLPFIVQTIGKDAYGGIWAIVGTLTMSLGLLDLGTGTAFVKYISEYYARNDQNALSQVVNTGFALYTVFGLVVLPLTWIIGDQLLSLVGVPAALMSDGVFVLRIGMVVFVLANVLSPLTAVVTGIQRMEINLVAVVSGQAVNIAGCLTVLHMGWGVRGLILNNLAVLIISSLILGWSAIRLVPSIRFGFVYCSKEMAKRFLAYGMNLQISKLSQVLLFQVDRVLTLRVFGPSAAAFYDIGGRLCNGGRSVSTLTISALIPAVSELEAMKDRERLLTLYRRGSKYVTTASTFVFLFIGLFATDIMQTWMGPGYDKSIVIVSALAIGYFFNVASGIASALAAGIGRTEFERRAGLLTAGLNVITILVCAYFLGPVGIAIGTSISLFIGGVFMLYQVDKFLDNPAGVVWASYGKPVLLGIVTGIMALVLRTHLFAPIVSRGEGVAVILASATMFALLFGASLWLFRVLDISDLKTLQVVRSAGPPVDPS
jgi:O-antigen/teichoic acid export membrane protein